MRFLLSARQYDRIEPEGKWSRMLGYRCDWDTQKKILFEILSGNTVLFEIIRQAHCLALDRYYIGAGCICQTVWNAQNGLEPMYGISDIDIVYFDEDLSYEKEDQVQNHARQLFGHLPVLVDIKNQARVHLWYRDHYGYDLSPYSSVEAAIDSWPATASAVGVRLTEEKFVVYAPYGLNDLFGQIVRANKTQITEETYLEKCRKWKEKWDTLTIVKW